MSPFASKRQERFAFATHQPWAEEWASKTDEKSLPEKKKSGKKGSKRYSKSKKSTRLHAKDAKISYA